MIPIYLIVAGKLQLTNNSRDDPLQILKAIVKQRNEGAE